MATHEHSEAPMPTETAQLVENLEVLRHQMAATVLEIRERYQHLSAIDEPGQRLLSAAVKELEEVDTKLKHLRRTNR